MIKQGYDCDLLIVVVTFNSEKYIEECLQSIVHLVEHLDNILISVCVVDNSSSDSTREKLRRFETKYHWLNLILSERNVGFGSANNLAFENYAAKAYFLLNVDAYFIGDSISTAYRYLESAENVGILGLSMVYPSGAPQTSSFVYSSWHRWLLFLLGFKGIAIFLLRFGFVRWVAQRLHYTREFSRLHNQNKSSIPAPKTYNRQLRSSNEIRNVDWVSGAAMLLSRKFLQDSEGFDHRIFLYGEDEDLCITAKRLSYSVEAIDTVPVVHYLGWERAGFRKEVSFLKFSSLKYFINKNIKSRFNRALMRIILPFYVFGSRAPMLIVWAVLRWKK